jgi:DNA-binding response OmpR family regulator
MGNNYCKHALWKQGNFRIDMTYRRRKLATHPMATTHLETILFVDDDPELREIVAAALAEPGYAIVTASDGYEAIRILADNRVGLLITDIKMPGINGFDLARRAKIMRPSIQIIYLSGYPIGGAHSAGTVYGAILKKPLRMGDLLAEVSGRRF